jgi:DNA-binding transcriptional ArsR family regulator
MDYRQLAERLKAAAHPIKLTLLSMLAEGVRPAGAIRDGFGPDASPTYISIHLALLSAAGLVDHRRVGNHRAYRLTESGHAMIAVAKVLTG